MFELHLIFGHDVVATEFHWFAFLIVRCTVEIVQNDFADINKFRYDLMDLFAGLLIVMVNDSIYLA